jgi:hypothetical protein
MPRGVRVSWVALGIALAWSCRPAQRGDSAIQTSHQGSFALVRRGDTTVTDDYVRTPTTLEGLVRPRVSGAKFGWARYRVMFSPSGVVTHSQLSLGRVGSSPDSAPTGTYSTRFGPHEIIEQWPNRVPTRVPYQEGAVPLFGPSIAMVQEVIARAAAIRGDNREVTVPVYPVLVDSTLRQMRVSFDGDTVRLSDRENSGAAYVFRDGRLLGSRPGDSEFVTVRRELPAIVPRSQPPAYVHAAALDSAARAVLAFLRGDARFDDLAVADSVVLFVGREAGGTRTVVRREQLRQRGNWVARSALGNYALVPPSSLTRVTTKPGTHFVCHERQLALFFPDLARRPHVGVLLTPETMQSCLQVWNLTLVFDADSARPRLVAAVYDQFEW